MSLSHEHFFDLSSFFHKDLFSPNILPWNVVKNLEKYLKNLSLGKIEGDISDKAFLIQPESISIGKGSIVEPGAYIQGPCVIGENCVIRHSAYIRGSVLTGHGCVIGHDTEVKSSILLNGAHAAHFAYLGNTILGNNVNLGAGVKCANFKLDHQTIHIYLDGQKIDTGQRKLGAIIGDNTQIGCNSVTNPGALIGKDVRCYPCLNVQGFIPSRSLIKPNFSNSITTYNKEN